MPCMLCGCKRSTHKLLDMLQHKEVCWIPSFGGQLLQHNANQLRYAAVLMSSPVSTTCKSYKTGKKQKGCNRKKRSGKEWNVKSARK